MPHGSRGGDRSQASQSSGQSACVGNDRSRPYRTRRGGGASAAPALLCENLSALTSVSSLYIDQFVGVIQAVVQGKQAALAPPPSSSSTSTSLNMVGSIVSMAVVGVTSRGPAALLPSATVTWLTINSLIVSPLSLLTDSTHVPAVSVTMLLPDTAIN